MIFIDHAEKSDGKITIVEIKGELNSATITDFEDYINQLLTKRKIFIILNAEKIDYISSGGIGVILYIQKKILAARGFFIVCNVSEEISALYEILGFDKIIKISKNLEEALDIMDKQLHLIGSEKIDVPAGNDTAINNLIEIHERMENNGESGTSFENPIILECSTCNGLIRVKKSGTYICPDCKTEFSVEPDQTVVF